MTQKTKQTDGGPFREYLYTLCMNCLIEHAQAILFYEVIIEVILKNEYMHKDCLFKLTKVKSDLKDKALKYELTSELNKAEEELIIELIGEVFSKNLIIDTLIEYTDEGAREDLIYNQNEWNKSVQTS
jgi:hypothetical protein